MTSAFSSSESAALEREIKLESLTLTLEKVWDATQKCACSEWINKNNFEKVCLQFPDDQLTFSTKISDELRTECPAAQFFILADTSYGSCCVDEIAAAHVQADSIIHFGNACQSKVSRLPVFYVFPKFGFDVDQFAKCVAELKFDDDVRKVAVYLDAGFHHIFESGVENDLAAKLQEGCPGCSVRVEKFPTILRAATEQADDISIFVGNDNQAFFNLSMSATAGQWFIYEPEKVELKRTDPMTTQWIRRRYFYIATCKEAQTIGLIVATLTADGYLDIVKRIQEMARARGKRTHLISVGRINPAKLANFMEIDCFVLIGCPFNNMFTSRDYFKPIVSVFEAEMALNPAWNQKFPAKYSLDFQDVLPDGRQYEQFLPENIEENDVSLVSGNMMRGRPDGIGNGEVNGLDGGGVVVERKNFQLMETNGGVVFEDRSWRGLEQNLGRTEPAKITKGLSGIPTNYTHE